MSYIDLVKYYESCFQKYGDNNRGVDWPNEQDAKKRYQIMLDVVKYDSINEKKDNVSILDFGCGLAHLYGYMINNNVKYKYLGMDMSNEFIKKCKDKYPAIDFFQCDILKERENYNECCDYICINGVFTEKREMKYEEMLSYFKFMIKRLFNMCNRGIVFNVMSKDVDWERDDLFHLPMSELSDFLTKQVSRNFVIRNDYGLYEYTTYVYKKSNKEV